MKDASGLRMACVSDIHLGHSRTVTSFITKNLYKAFPDNQETAELDIVFIAGDVFDGLLSLPDQDIIEIEQWIFYMLRLCKKHDILLRVLNGTPSHDWNQCIRFEHLNKSAKIGCDLKYFPNIAIEYIEKFNINVLYINDEAHPTTDQTLSVVRELLKSRGLDKVDYAIMHGAFPHQLPEPARHNVHDTESYLRIVDKLIFIGHIHIFTNYDRIIAQGSFDRIAHGEEAPKGHVRAFVKSAEDYEVTFVENEGARKYITVDCQGLDLEESIKEILEKIKYVPDDSSVRVAMNMNNPLVSDLQPLKLIRPFIDWSKIVKDGSGNEVRVVDEELSSDSFTPITITAENITSLVMDRLKKSEAVTPEYLQTAEQILLEVK
jgi:DNA repair exonuclease SbcCD nuclease subunit